MARQGACNICGDVGDMIKLQIAGIKPEYIRHPNAQQQSKQVGGAIFDVCRPISGGGQKTIMVANQPCLESFACLNQAVLVQYPMLRVEVVEEDLQGWHY